MRHSHERAGGRAGGDSVHFHGSTEVTLGALMAEARSCQMIPWADRTPKQKRLAAWYRKESGHWKGKRSGNYQTFASKPEAVKDRIRVNYIRNRHREHLMVKEHGTANRFEAAHFKKLGFAGGA